MALLGNVTEAIGATTTPSTVNAAYGQSTTVTVHYLMPTAMAPITSYNSSIGHFYLPSLATPTPIGAVNLNLTTSTRQVSEVLTIPQTVIERALRAGASTFYYSRTFASTPGGYGDTFALNINIVPGSVAGFSLRRIELYFDNMQKRNEVMVQRNFKGLKAYADIYYNGSGFLNGYWEVDGLIIERVNRFVPAGGKVTLATPSIPDLPTFDPGYHIVKFIVTNPETSFEVPEMVYWVKGAEEPVKRALALIKPLDGMDIPTNFPFEWEKMEKASLYLISFAKAEDKTVCFSALTRDTAYRIPPSVLSEYLSPGKKYLWSVKGFDTESNIIAESGVQSFYFKEAAKP
jgi:hypothetical protein